MTTVGHNQFKTTLVKQVKGPSPKLQELRQYAQKELYKVGGPVS